MLPHQTSNMSYSKFLSGCIIIFNAKLF